MYGTLGRTLVPGKVSMLESVPSPRFFEWNFRNHPVAQISAYDFDGVLCFDPSRRENDDGRRYLEFLANAQPLFVPKYRISVIVTSRLEKYRQQTEEWLNRNGIEFNELVMLDGVSAVERRKRRMHASFKAEFFFLPEGDSFL